MCPIHFYVYQDIRLFSVVKEWIAKMLYKTKDGIKTFLEIIKQAFIDLWDYFKSWFSKKQSIKEAKKVEKHESDRIICMEIL